MRTTLLGLMLALSAIAVPVHTGHAQSPDPALAAMLAEVAGYRLTMDGFNRWLAALENLAEAREKDPGLTDAVELDAAAGVTAMIARIEAEPRLREPIESAGLTVREYMVATSALLQAMYLQASLEQGVIDKVPEGVNPDNIEFVARHQQELQQAMARMQGTDGGAGGVH